MIAMAKSAMSGRQDGWWGLRAARRGLPWVASIASIAWFTGCAVEFQNRQPSQELARQSKPPGSVYSGWRVFEDKCAGCHGSGATGKQGAPDLLARVRGLGPRQFVDVLLTRYEWTVPPAQPAKTTPEREAYIDDIVQRRKGAIAMPEWQGEPRVNAHVIDLYAYLSARAEGTQGPGRPAP
jgi:mono/diheme cytochrome c family protein